MARTKLKFSPRGKPNRYQTYHHAAARPKLLADRIQSPILVAPTLLHRIESVDRVQEHRDLQAEAEDFLRASLLESEQDMDTTASGDNEVARSEETLRLAASELLTTPSTPTMQREEDDSDDELVVTLLNEQEPPGPAPSQSTPSHSIEECRKMLVPIITKNIESRNRNSTTIPEQVREAVAHLLTDEKCSEFIQISKRLEARLSGDATTTGSPKTELSDFMKNVRESVQRASELSTSVLQSAVPITDSDMTTCPCASSSGAPQPVSRSTMSISGSSSYRESLPPASTSSRSTPSVPPQTPVADEIEEGELVPVSDTFVFRNPFNGEPINDRGEYTLEYVSEKSKGKRRATSNNVDEEEGRFVQMDVDELEEGQVVEHHHSQAVKPMLSVEQQSRPLESPLEPPPPAEVSKSVPGMWCFTQGKAFSDILEERFVIDEQIHQKILKWRNRDDFVNSSDKPHCEPVALQIQCVAEGSLMELEKRMATQNISDEETTKALRDLPCVWPTPGKLLIQVNTTHEEGRTWFAQDLVDNKPLEISSATTLGPNFIRFVQLGDLSNFFFVVHAVIPEVESQQQQERRRSSIILMERFAERARDVSESCFH